MSYHVTRQKGYYDEGVLRIEIATDRDEISPGMLVPNYDEEGEYGTAQEAVDAANQLQVNHFPCETRPEITISSMASIGMYPTSADGKTTEELYQWAVARDRLDMDEHPHMSPEMLDESW